MGTFYVLLSYACLPETHTTDFDDGIKLVGQSFPILMDQKKVRN